MMTIRTLEHIPVEIILEAFNLAFSDYIVPLRLTKEQFEDKIENDSIALRFSVGAFEDDQLIAFILHGYDVTDNLKVVYNAGTGVIPGKRGSKLTATLYQYILPVFHENSIDKITLEVITTNEAAIKTYKNTGFSITRTLNCFKGSPILTKPNNDLEVSELKAFDWPTLQSFWDLKPSWQNSITAVEKLKHSNMAVGIFAEGKLVGYTIYNPKIKRLHQLAVESNYRKRGVAQKLLEQVSTDSGNVISITNIDSTAQEVTRFLTSRGMEIFVQQYEMELPLK